MFFRYHPYIGSTIVLPDYCFFVPVLFSILHVPIQRINLHSWYFKNFYVFVSLLLYCVEATGFSLTIVGSAPPNAENISHQQLVFVRLDCF